MVHAPFIWGRAGAKLTPDQVAREREAADLLAKGAMDFSPVAHWSQGLGRVAQGLLAGLDYRRAAQGEEQIAGANKNLVAALLGGSSAATPAASSAIPMTSAAGEVAATAPGSAQPIDMTGNQVFSEFIGAAREGGLTNPFGLAALAATGKAESGFDPGNVNRTWSDPSESGQPGTAGGILSWRGPRYQALAATGDLSPRGQGNFFIQENPQLITALNNAKSIEEAQSLINNAWQFAGFNRPGGEAARRLALARSFLPTFQGGGEVAAVTPQTATDAIEAVAPIQPIEQPTSPMSFAGQETAPTTLSDEVLAFQQTPEYAARFPSRNTLRPFQPGETRPNPDGSYSTEITTTWKLPDGSWVNVPSLWMGPNGPQQFSPDDEDNILGAMQQYEAQNGPTFQRFGSEQEAVSAAEARSSEGGAGAGPQLMADFSGSNQLSNAQGGIIPALTGGIPASPEQIARAQAAAQAPIEVAGGGDRVPMAPAGINPAIIEALTNPQASPQTQRLAGILLEQEQRKAAAAEEQRLQAADPLRQLQIRKAQAEVDALGRPQIDGVTVGNRVIDRNTGRVIYEAPQADATFRQATPEEAQKFGAAAGQFGPDGRFYPINPPQGTSLSVDPNTGAVTFNQGAGVKPLTESQSKDSFFATRMSSAVPTLDKYEQSLLSLPEAAAGAIPMNLGRYAQSEEYQLAKDAGDDFVAAYLRKDSGAALTPNEKREYGNLLLPQPGDKPAITDAKRRRRLVAIEAIKSGLPPSAVDGVLKALEAVPGSTEASPTSGAGSSEKPISEMTDEELEALANGD